MNPSSTPYGEHRCALCCTVIPNSAEIKECRLENCPEIKLHVEVTQPSPSATLSADPSEEVIEAMADCLLKTHNRVTREEVIAAWRVARASIVSEIAERPCATCNDDPAVCATVPGLRHCERAARGLDVPASAPSATPCTQYRSIGMVYLTPDGVIAASLEPNVELPAKECIIYVSEGKRV